MDDLHSPCVGMGDGLTASDLRAEIARLRAELDSEKQRASDWSAAAVTQRKRAEDAESALSSARAELDAAKAERDSARAALKSAVDPVRQWFDGDGEIEPSPTDADIARMAVEELQRDREELLALKRANSAGVAWQTVLEHQLSSSRAALAKEMEACDEVRRFLCVRRAFSPEDEWCHRYDARRAAEANPYPITVESSPSATDDTITAVRYGAPIGKIVNLRSAEAKEPPR